VTRQQRLDTPRRSSRRRLAGMRAVVTGGSSGVGRALALALSRRGCRVLATARRQERLAELARHPDTAAEPIEHEAGDICDPDFRRHLVATAAERLGGIDLIVAAAGSGGITPFRSADPALLGRLLDVNLVAPAGLLRAALPWLTRGTDPAVILVGSILGLHPLPLHGEYCAAKSGLRALAGALRIELATEGIDVLLATLGPVESEFWTALVAGERPAWSRGRGMSPDEVALAILTGLERRRAEVLPGWQAKGYAFLARFLPGLIDRWATRHWRTDSAGRSRREEPHREG
jgi:short-subunit dehydrogenase